MKHATIFALSIFSREEGKNANFNTGKKMLVLGT
jgi:hypothetical protein